MLFRSQGAQVYFGKDLSQVTIAEAAMLAGLPQGPSLYDPFRNPDRAIGRRNIILKLMRDNDHITAQEYEQAVATPLTVKREAVETSDAPYFVDLVAKTLEKQFPQRDFRGSAHKIYTTLDLELQRDAVEAVLKGITETDTQWKRRNKNYGTAKFPRAQVALVALDAETGEVQIGRAHV